MTARASSRDSDSRWLTMRCRASRIMRLQQYQNCCGDARETQTPRANWERTLIATMLGARSRATRHQPLAQRFHLQLCRIVLLGERNTLGALGIGGAHAVPGLLQSI